MKQEDSLTMGFPSFATAVNPQVSIAFGKYHYIHAEKSIHCFTMIHFIVVQNRQGKTRLAKWYSSYDDGEKQKILTDVHRIVTSRSPKFTNFVEYQQLRLVYRRYAGLYFIFCVDPTDNELAALEGIHNFVEMLDIYFHNVCELDLVFNFYKVFAVLDEFCLAGEIMETNKRVVIEKMDELDKLD